MELKDDIVILSRKEYEAMLNIIAEQEKRINTLEGMLHKNSSNSHKPPSTDVLNGKIKNSREKSNRKSGAQEKHEGKTLEMTENPDKVIKHKIKGCCNKCGKNLEDLEIKEIQRKQVFDLPQKLYEVTEHQMEVKQCSCGCIHVAKSPVQGGSTQYGEKMKALIVYMSQYQFLPYERLQDFMKDVFGLSLGGGTIEASNEITYEQLEKTEQQIKKGLFESSVIHNDETGIRCAGKTQWVHNTSNEKYTHYTIHPKRGTEAINAIGILPDYKGNSVHDRYASYDQYNCTHSLCNAHLLRDLKFVHEELQKDWAGKMIRLLILALYLKKRNWLNKSSIANIMQRYFQILEQEKKEEENFILPVVSLKRGRKAKPKSLRLLETFINRQEQILRFVHNKDTPFDNNLAERDLRMIKLKQKISGCLRTIHGAEVFCRIRGYISTVRKQGYRVLESLEHAIAGNPVIVYHPAE